MARSYKSALPTWSTYTPYSGPLNVHPAINPPNYRGVHGQGLGQMSNIHGWLGHKSGEIASMVRGTGTANVVGQMMTHRPLTALAAQAASGSTGSRGGWISAVRRAMGWEVDEETAGDTAPPPQTVNPVAVATKAAATATGDALGGTAVASRKMGSSSASPESALNPSDVTPIIEAVKQRTGKTTTTKSGVTINDRRIR